MTRDKADEILTLEPTTCSCRTCVEMCEQRPCWPTPAEAETLIKAGYAKRLMYDYWIGSPTGSNDSWTNTHVIGPAMIGHEGKCAPWVPHGRCTFLKDGKCELHDLGLKPIEGRLASCVKSQVQHQLHQAVAVQWEGKLGEYIHQLWRKNVENQATK